MKKVKVIRNGRKAIEIPKSVSCMMLFALIYFLDLDDKVEKVKQSEVFGGGQRDQ